MLKIQKKNNMLSNEDGVGVVEIVLILVVLIALILLFKNQITALMQSIFKNIGSRVEELQK